MKAANLRLSISSKAPGVQAGMADAAPKQFQLPSNYMEAFIKGGECTARASLEAKALTEPTHNQHHREAGPYYCQHCLCALHKLGGLADPLPCFPSPLARP